MGRVQQIIDVIRRKEERKIFESMKETVIYLSNSIDFDKKIANTILNAKFNIFTYKKYKKILSDYLKTIDATKIPKAKGKLRNYQLELLQLIKDVIPKMEENGISPLLTGGTLLGAVRHGGFIPWDDDVDFDLIREDYEKALAYIQKNYFVLNTRDCTNYDEFYSLLDKAILEHPNEIIWARKPIGLCAYRGTSLSDVKVLDFFCLDYIKETIQPKQYISYRHSYDSKFKKNNNWGEIFSFYRVARKNNKIFVNESSLLARGWDSFAFVTMCKSRFFKQDDVFPISRVNFEGVLLPTYKNYIRVLETYFTNYQNIPANSCIGMHIKNLNLKCHKNKKSFYITTEEILKNKDLL